MLGRARNCYAEIVERERMKWRRRRNDGKSRSSSFSSTIYSICI